MSASAAPGDGRPLTRTQSLIWTSQRLHPDAPVANMGKRSRISGALDPDRLVRAFDAVARRTEALRTVVATGPDGDHATVLDVPPGTTTVLDLPASELDRWCDDRIGVPVDATSCAFDSVLLRHGDDDWTWWLDLHHVVTDATSSAIVFAATAAAYEADGADPDVPGGRPFSDWAAEHQERAAADDAARAERAAGWEQELEAAAPGPIAPYGPRGAATSEVRRVPLPLDDEATARIEDALASDFRSISRELGLLAFVSTAVAIALHRLDGRRSIVVGVPVHHRGRGAIDVVGPLMELYPLVVDVGDAGSARALHGRVMKGIVTLLRRAKPGESPTFEPDAVVNVLGVRYEDFAGIPTRTEWMRSSHAEPTHPVGVQVYDYGGDVRWIVDLNGALSADGSHARFPDHLARVLAAIAAEPDAPTGSIALVGDDELAELALLDPVPDPRPGLEPVHERIRHRLGERPDLVVAEHRGTTLAAGDFDARADRVAGWLVARGVARGSRVGIRMARGLDVLVAIHAVLRSGAAFVLLEPDDPPARHDAIAVDADLVLILDELPRDAAAPFEPVAVDLDDEAYVLYTSGSTGLPKGVPIPHRGLADYLAFAVDAYVERGDEPVVALHSSLVFDLTITSLFLSFLTGGRVVIHDEDAVDALGRIATDERVTFLKATPSQLDVLTQVAPGPLPFRTVVVGGEAFRRPTAERLAALCPPGARIFNEYGPTEAVVGCMIHRWDPALDLGSDVPIGHAAPGSQVVVLDGAGQPAAAGSWGELYVRRPGMAAGYLNRPELTAELFVTLGGDPSPWYRTGDRVRTVRPGVLVYGGRFDDQMKVGGVRLEPAEVEAVLVAVPGVSSAVVRLWAGDDGADEVLTAWYLTADGAPIDPDELRLHLRRSLPERAVPAAFVHLDRIPIAASAKVDVAALPAPTDRDRRGGSFVAPATDVEEAIAAIWADRLHLDTVGVHDDFFDLGGASLSALEVVAAIDERFGTELPDAAVFTARTVRSLAALVDESPAATSAPAPARAGEIPRLDGRPELSTGQAALLFDLRADPGTSRYSVTRHYRFPGPIDADRLRAALLAVIARHDTLRITFGTPRRELTPDEALDWRVVESPAGERWVDDLARTPLDVDDGPLVRVVLADGPHPELVLTLHHLWCDARSFDVLWHDVAVAYRGAEPVPLPVRYSDHAAWQAGRVTADDVAFWTDRLAAVEHAPDLGLRRPAVPEPDRLLVRAVPLPAGRSAARTTFVDFLVAVDLVLSRYTDDPVVVGAPMTVRDRPEADDMVGYFLNTVVLPLPDVRVETEVSVGALAGAIEHDLAGAIRHRHVPLADVMAERSRVGAAEPLAGVMVVHDPPPSAGLDGLPATGRTVFNGSAVTELSLLVADTPSGVDVSAEWSGARYAGADVEALLDQVIDVFVSVVAAGPGRSVAELVPEPPADLVGVPVPELEPVTDAIWRHAGRTPDAPAVGQGDDVCTYGELTDAAEAVAGGLRSRGVTPGDCVALLVPRSVEQVAAILGVLRSGAAYVPIDTAAPPRRVAAILASVDPALVVAGAGVELPDGVAAASVADLAAADGGPPPPMPALDGPAYVIHTSGSTGEPRGVLVTHRQLAASTAARPVEYGRDPERFVWTSSYGFDSSIVGLFWTLTTGGGLVLPDATATVDVDHLIDVIERSRATDVLTVPSLWSSVLRRVAARGRADRLASLRSVIVAGEAVSADVVGRHLDAGLDAALANEYGPTEATVWATVHRCDHAEDPVPIGHAVPGTVLRVAGADLTPRPVGVAGELLIGGALLTGGYVGDPVATAERFVSAAGERWYRTGDVVVRRTDGVLEFVGRLDDQLSVHGVRVEPDEIERVAEAFAGVHDALARVDRRGRTPTLVLHVEADRVDLDALGTHLADHLPPALVPRRTAVVAELPRTPNGKLDRRAPLPDDGGSGDRAPTGTAAPTGSVLATVIDVWARVFDDVAVDAESDFFDIGGSSLDAVELVVALENALRTDLTIGALLNGRTPRGLAELVESAAGERAGAGTPTAEAATTSDRLVVLRPAQAAPAATVLVVPAWDDVFGYVALVDALSAAGLATDVQVLGLQYRVPTAESGVQTVPELSEVFVRDLAAAGVDGPYTVLGWSTSGLVAYDLADRLVASGADVSSVALVDTYFPGEERHLWANRWNKYRGLIRPSAAAEVRKELGKAVQRRRRRLDAWTEQRRAAKRDRRSAPPIPAAQDSGPRPSSSSTTPGPTTPPPAPARRAAPVSQVFPPGAFAYDAGPANVPVVLYSATATNEARTAARWRSVAPGLEVVRIEGRHRGLDSIMDAGRVENIAADLAARIAR